MKNRSTRCPVLNLDADGELDPQAYFKLLSVMAFPGSTKDRHAFMEAARRAMAVGRDVEPGPGFKNAIRDGAVAGDHLIWVLQEHVHEGRATLSGTLPFVRAALLSHNGFTDLSGFPNPEGLVGEERKRVTKGETGRVHRRDMLHRFSSFRSVAHLWGACVLAHNPKDTMELVPSTPARLCRMISVAEAITDVASTVRMPRLDPPVLMPMTSTWRIRIPQHLHEAGKLDFPPIPSFARQIVRRFSP